MGRDTDALHPFPSQVLPSWQINASSHHNPARHVSPPPSHIRLAHWLAPCTPEWLSSTASFPGRGATRIWQHQHQPQVLIRPPRRLPEGTTGVVLRHNSEVSMERWQQVQRLNLRFTFAADT